MQLKRTRNGRGICSSEKGALKNLRQTSLLIVKSLDSRDKIDMLTSNIPIQQCIGSHRTIKQEKEMKSRNWRGRNKTVFSCRNSKIIYIFIIKELSKMTTRKIDIKISCKKKISCISIYQRQLVRKI